MSLSAFLVILASLTSPGTGAGQAAQAVKVTVDVPTGTTLTGERIFKVLVSTDDIVTKVEMYVGTELRGDESSTPYRFTLDSINEKDGPLDLKWVAYTDQGHKGSATIHLKVDNGMGLGAAAHVQTGMQSLQDGKAVDAITQGRIALKIDKKYTPARFLLARAYEQQGVYDKAQKFVQDVIDDDPKNLDAFDLSSAISLRQAFSVINQGGQTMDTLNTIETAFKTAVDARRKYVDAKLDATPTPKDDASLLVYANAAISALRFSDAINLIDPVFRKAPSRADLADRLAYCQMRAGRLQDALGTLDLLKRVGANNSDAYAQALTAVLQADLGNRDASKSAMEDAELNDISSVAVQTAQASIALRQSNTAALQGIATSLERDEGQRTEVDYLLAALYNRIGNYSQERRFFERCVLAEPLNYDMYIEEANSALALVSTKAKKEDADFQYAYAETMFKMALEAKSDSYQALTGLALVNGLRGKNAEAFKFAQSAVAAQPGYASAQVALSVSADLEARAVRPRGLPSTDPSQKAAFDAAVKRANELDLLAVDSINAAGKIDPANAGGRSVPSMKIAFQYFSRYGRSPIIARPS